MPPGHLYSPGWMAPILSENRMVLLDGCETELFGVGADSPSRGCTEPSLKADRSYGRDSSTGTPLLHALQES